MCWFTSVGGWMRHVGPGLHKNVECLGLGRVRSCPLRVHEDDLTTVNAKTQIVLSS